MSRLQAAGAGSLSLAVPSALGPGPEGPALQPLAQSGRSAGAQAPPQQAGAEGGAGPPHEPSEPRV